MLLPLKGGTMSFKWPNEAFDFVLDWVLTALYVTYPELQPTAKSGAKFMPYNNRIYGQLGSGALHKLDDLAHDPRQSYLLRFKYDQRYIEEYFSFLLTYLWTKIIPFIKQEEEQEKLLSHIPSKWLQLMFSKQWESKEQFWSETIELLSRKEAGLAWAKKWTISQDEYEKLIEYGFNIRSWLKAKEIAMKSKSQPEQQPQTQVVQPVTRFDED